jgi:CheY-like chemotaxis protein
VAWILPPAGGIVARILVVEDSPDNMKLFRTLLALKGHEVTALAGGDDLLETIDRADPELVLMDIQLPGKDGFALLAEIRQSPHAGLRVLALTAGDAGWLRGLHHQADRHPRLPRAGEAGARG